MALIDGGKYEFKFLKKKKNGTWETEEEMMKRVDREDKQYEKKEYDNNIKRIMKKGFSKEQAKYLHQLEINIKNAYYHKSLHDMVF